MVIGSIHRFAILSSWNETPSESVRKKWKIIHKGMRNERYSKSARKIKVPKDAIWIFCPLEVLIGILNLSHYIRLEWAAFGGDFLNGKWDVDSEFVWDFFYRIGVLLLCFLILGKFPLKISSHSKLLNWILKIIPGIIKSSTEYFTRLPSLLPIIIYMKIRNICVIS